jgi:two-component system, OmpR family, KDP operon response regulator KdpE
MRKERVLIVDDDPQLQRLLRAQLLALEMDVQVADRGEDAIKVAVEFQPDMILLAHDLPGITGLETTRRMREWTQTPIILLNGKDQKRHTVLALDTGADDYVEKPFVMAELLARMRAVLRRTRAATSPSAPVPLTFRNLVVDLVNRRVLLDGQPLHLTPTEYELLRVLVTHAGRILTHRELLTRVWGPESSRDTQYLHVFVSQLRRKLEAHPDAPRHIFTEPGVGYCFSAEA